MNRQAFLDALLFQLWVKKAAFARAIADPNSPSHQLLVEAVSQVIEEEGLEISFSDALTIAQQGLLEYANTLRDL